MQISGTFLNSAIAKRIALILFLAAFVPTALMTGLTHHTIEKLVNDHSHKKLVETSHNYALSAFSNLTFAQTTLLHLAAILDPTNPALPDKFEELGSTMFRSWILVTPEGKVLDQSGKATYYSQSLFRDTIKPVIDESISNAPRLLVLPSANNGAAANIALILPRLRGQNSKTTLIAEIDPDYLWGDISDYPSDISVCAYRIDSASRTRLFCSLSPETSSLSEDSSPENMGEWELFLRAAFNDNAWSFVTKRQFPVTFGNIGNFISSYAYFGVALTSLLMVALLSLIQIRKTMGPLEKLIEATKQISIGRFSEVQVDRGSEFGELADAFNGMSAHIKRQFNTLQALSMIDRDIVSRLDVDHLIRQVIARAQQIMPASIVCVTRLDEKTSVEAQCSMAVSDNATLTSHRAVIPTGETNVIETYGIGHFCQCNKASSLVHESLLAGLGAKHCWVLPIFWQGEMCAFLSIGSKEPLQADDPAWEEMRELAGRIGIAISAQEREDQLLIQAQYDSLTGLPNRILLQDRLRQAIDHSGRTGNSMWVAFLDLDRFKFVNDSLGHKAGDDLLTSISKRLQQTVRDTDTVARFGGDEFVIILQEQTDENLRMGILHRLIEAVATPVILDRQEIVTTCSIGIAVHPADGSTPDALVKHADIAMYRAKELGKNNFQFFTQYMNEKVKERLRTETHLRKALELNEFALYYQPKVDLNTKQIVGMEALLRWKSKELGFISPAQFIALAEETGLIVPIGEWALRTACAQAVAWQKAGFGKMLMSVNLSIRQFRHTNLIESIACILKETGLQASCLELELTESLVMNEYENSIKILHDIKSLGIHLSIDDFGTGYSSLSYLKNLPLDTLKIDKSFIDEITIHSEESPIVASIISLAKNLKLNVVAEGVESYEQVMYLISHGCDEMQGYYFSRPEPAEGLENMLRTRKTLLPIQSSAIGLHLN
ncbi:MAG: EAL domain-containing protein [Sulfurimicrobium sp.]|nr:EAL domain-containing protein [Sulfurimicrobium sp.]